MNIEFRQLAQAVEALAQDLAGRLVGQHELRVIEAFQELVKQAVAYDAESRRDQESRGVALARALDEEWSLRAFLARSDFLRRVAAGHPVNGVELVESYLREKSRKDTQITQLVVIDGLDAVECDFGAARLVKIDRVYLDRFFEGEAVDGSIRQRI